MKTVLCVSPHFPPANTPDMQRLRQSLPYFEDLGWRPVVFTVDPAWVECELDPLLLETLPNDLEIHQVHAIDAEKSRKFGIGNLGLRCYRSLKAAVDGYLKQNQVDLIYFSTTVFSVLALGPSWKKRFGTPFVIDMQDPWRNDYYFQQTRIRLSWKYRAYHLMNSVQEALTIPHASGLVSVSQGYIDELKQRYPAIAELPSLVQPFTVLERDFDIAAKLDPVKLQTGSRNIVYIGRGGKDLTIAVTALLKAVKDINQGGGDDARLRCYFIGTSYAPKGQGVKTIEPIARSLGIESDVVELTDRVSYFQALSTLKAADLLFAPGSDDERYTASKILPNLMAGKPLVSIFHEKSLVNSLLRELRLPHVVFNRESNLEELSSQVRSLINQLRENANRGVALPEEWTSKGAAARQVELFDEAICPALSVPPQ